MIFKVLILSAFCCAAINSFAIEIVENGNVDYIVGQIDSKNTENVIDKFQASIESAVSSSKASMQIFTRQKDFLLADLMNELVQLSNDDSENNVSDNIERERDNLNASFKEQEMLLVQTKSDFLDQLAAKKQDFDDKIEELKSRKENFNTCENNDEYEDASTCDEISQSIDSQINALRLEVAAESKIIEKKLRKLKDEMKQSFIDYQNQLIQIYKKKILQMEADKEKANKVQIIFKNTIKLYEKHAERVEGLLESLQGNVTTISEKFPEINVVNLDFEATNTDCSWKRWNDLTTDLEENAVIGGQDVDGTPLYVIRSRSDDSMPYSYGKFAVERTHAYITDDEKEFGVRGFELFTCDLLNWCPYDEAYKYEDPICRGYLPTNEDVLIPGTLQDDGTCRIGYGYKSYRLMNFEILTFAQC